MGRIVRAISKDASVVCSAIDGKDIVSRIEQIHKTFGTLENVHSLQRLNITFDQITKKNKQIDQQWQDLIKTVKSLNIPKLAEMKALTAS